MILTSLSNQLEYYFSQQNLAKDTYLETLRSLNDGCVPVSILANFQKVKSILPRLPDSLRTALVVQAASEFSESLRVVYVDGQTSTVVEEGSEIQPTSILAVCTMDKQPLKSAPTASTNSSADQNSTIVILRDVPDGITDDDVRSLFAFQGCPPVAEVRFDVGNCW